MKAPTTILLKSLKTRTKRWLWSSYKHVALSVIKSRDSKSEHKTWGVSKGKPSCLLVELFFLSFRVGALRLSMAQQFSFLGDILCKGNVESRPLSRLMFWWPEGQGFGSSEGDNGHSVSQESSGATNDDMNFTSSDGSVLGWCSTFGISMWVGEAVLPNSSFRLPWEKISWKSFSRG